MTDALDWNEEQWSAVNKAVHDEALRARVAASFLPLYGPLPADTQSVPLNKLDLVANSSGSPEKRLEVIDYDTLRLTTVSVNVYLKGAQVADPELAAAQIMFRRAAAVVARVEDDIIFNGQPGTGLAPKHASGAPASLPPIYTVSGGGKYPGLVEAGEDPSASTAAKKKTCTGTEVFEAVVAGINKLESHGYLGPYACVMGNGLFQAVTTPLPNSMVLPRDSILPFLDGPLLRSSTLPANKAVLVSLQGAPVEIVVPSDIAVKYLQTSAEGEHVFRVQQKFHLRIKEAQAICTITC
ncbi:encapsulin [uncultured Ruegeria sp.]|uniref:encapsulin n=1 Tax=uncultured Ruegeria sp. TaxID=259304 RepID=UPI002609A470|nr:family 1 encapsulin nanocompartment shell protein [uncultured Ruegeria sp.]